MNENFVPIDSPDIPGPLDAVERGTNSSITTMTMDMIDSTAQKFEKPLIASVTELMKMYTVWDKHLEAAQFPYVEKFAGDGLHVSADSTYAVDLVNLGVSMLAEFSELGTARNGQPRGEIDFQVRAGIATGPAFRFRTKNGGCDHLSTGCDRSARLCSAASAQALFIDPHTVNAANMTKVSSPLGYLLNRTPEEYLGEKEKVQFKGFPEPEFYYELLWSKGRFGVRSSLVTEISNTPPPRPPSPRPSSPAPALSSTDQFVGTMKVWMADRGYGFVTGPDGEDFHVSSRALLYAEDVEYLKTGTQIVFVPAEAAVAGRARRAVSVVVVGQEAEGRISFIHGEKPFGFIVATDDRGRDLRFHMVVDADLRASFKAGDEVVFQVAVDASGTRSRAMNVGQPGEEDASAA